MAATEAKIAAIEQETERPDFWANPDAAQLEEIGLWDPVLPDLYEPMPGEPGARFPPPSFNGAVVVGFWASADNSEADAPPPAPHPLAVKRVVQNSAVLNWFDIALSAFRLAEKRKIDWRV